ncbi:MAG: CPBP family intramembrane metalloprotease [Bacteroidia bacterium]|nr:CPBP family intramembrane metalloprotease [Bacteroidia bacterium]
MNKDLKHILLICLAFSGFFALDKLAFKEIFHFLDDFLHLYPLSFFLTYAFVGIPAMIYVVATHKSAFAEAWGLNRNPLKGILIAFIFALPMLLGFGISADFAWSLEVKKFWLGCVFAGFFEEFYYRGFFFGQIYRQTKLGFIPSILVSALIFASLHLYQSDDPSTLVGIFLTTFLGAGLFGWLYLEWNFNLWVPISLHFFMNLSWELFSVSNDALGDMQANLFRGGTVALAILGTIFYKKRMKIPLEVSKNTLILKKEFKTDSNGA